MRRDRVLYLCDLAGRDRDHDRDLPSCSGYECGAQGLFVLSKCNETGRQGSNCAKPGRNTRCGVEGCGGGGFLTEVRAGRAFRLVKVKKIALKEPCGEIFEQAVNVNRTIQTSSEPPTAIQ
jgi:hypothetical protein